MPYLIMLMYFMYMLCRIGTSPSIGLSQWLLACSIFCNIYSIVIVFFLFLCNKLMMKMMMMVVYLHHYKCNFKIDYDQHYKVQMDSTFIAVNA